jgi:hypothetical protein
MLYIHAVYEKIGRFAENMRRTKVGYKDTNYHNCIRLFSHAAAAEFDL